MKAVLLAASLALGQGGPHITYGDTVVVLGELELDHPDNILAQKKPVSEAPGWEVHFSPHGGCTESIVAAIQAVKGDTILVQAYNFTSAPIAAALETARKSQGDVVRIIVDAKAMKQKGCQAQVCKAAGCEVYADSKHAIAHNKVMVLGPRVLTGSFNYSSNAEERNAENCPISPPGWELRGAYVRNWWEHLGHAAPL